MKKIQEMEAIILAGGLGTRLRPAIGDIPKPMALVNDRPFLEHLMEYWIGQGVNRFILSVAYKHELIQKHFGHHFGGTEIDYAIDEGWGTGGGILQAISKLKNKDQSFLTLNGDTFFNLKLKDFVEFHRSKKANASLALSFVLDASRFGRVVLDRRERIVSFEPPFPGAGLINGGVYLFEPEFFKKIEKKFPLSIEKDIFPKAAAMSEEFYGFPGQGKFIDMGTPESYSICGEVLMSKQERKYA